MVTTWNTGPAAMRFRLNKKNKKIVRAQASKRPSSREGGPVSPQAKKFLTGPGIWDKMGLKKEK